MKKSILFYLCILLTSCTPSEDRWITLFNGDNLKGWHVYNRGEDYNGWTVEKGENGEGILVFDPLSKTHMDRTDLISNKEYTNFELSLEWKIGQYGNSGVFWGVVEDPQYKFSYNTGIEIQILDDNWEDYIKQNGDKTRAGALYGLMAPFQVVSKTTKDAWNQYLLHVDYSENVGWLRFNDQEVLRFPLHGPDWDAMVADSGFAGRPSFAISQKGHIVLQEYGGGVSFRNIKIRELSEKIN